MSASRDGRAGGTRPPATVRDRLVAAAFSQFAASGFEATTVDDIAAQAGVSRRTFFRYFATKEDAVFPDHEALRSVISADLERRIDDPPLQAVCAAVSLVLDDYVANRDVSLARFALTRRVTALRDREVTNVHRYQRLFARHLQERATAADEIDTELMAAAVVAAHNSVLREWLVTGGKDDPRARLTSVLHRVQSRFTDQLPSDRADTGIVAFAIGTPLSEIATAVLSLADHRAPPEPAKRTKRSRR